MFDIVPTVKDLFSFLRNSNLPLDHHPRFKQHALLVFNMVGLPNFALVNNFGTQSQERFKLQIQGKV